MKGLLMEVTWLPLERNATYRRWPTHRHGRIMPLVLAPYPRCSRRAANIRRSFHPTKSSRECS